MPSMEKMTISLICKAFRFLLFLFGVDKLIGRTFLNVRLIHARHGIFAVDIESLEKCCKENTNLVFVSKNDLEEISSSCDESVFRYKDRTYTIKLIGEHQLLNAATAIEVIDNSGIKVKEKSIVKG